jgi:hypothetical protein
MDNPEKLATLDPQDTRRRQTKQKTQHSTICVGHHYTQANTNIVCPHVLFHLAIVFFFGLLFFDLQILITPLVSSKSSCY